MHQYYMVVVNAGGPGFFPLVGRVRLQFGSDQFWDADVSLLLIYVDSVYVLVRMGMSSRGRYRRIGVLVPRILFEHPDRLNSRCTTAGIWSIPDPRITNPGPPWWFCECTHSVV